MCFRMFAHFDETISKKILHIQDFPSNFLKVEKKLLEIHHFLQQQRPFASRQIQIINAWAGS